MKLKVKVSVLIKSLGKIAIQKQNVIINDEPQQECNISGIFKESICGQSLT